MQNKKPSFSMFIAISIITAMSIVALSLVDIVINSISRTTEIQESMQAEYAAKSGLEIALYQLENMGPGYDSGTTSPNTFQLNDSTTATWYIQGSLDGKVNVESYGEYYTVPRKGTGDAYRSCTKTAKINGAYDDWLHPCNWQKIYPGQSISVPLYIKTKNGTIYNPNDLDMDQIRVILRTPCIYGTNAEGTCLDANGNASGSAYNVSSDFDDTIIVNWLIYGICDGSNYSVPTDCSAYSYKEINELGETNEKYDSRIKGVDINYYDVELAYYSLNEQLKINTNDFDQPKLKEFLRQSIYSIDKPILQMQSINALYSDTGSNIPYLEYQIQFYSDSNDKGYPNVSENIYSTGNTNSFTYQDEESKGIDSIINSNAISF